MTFLVIAAVIFSSGATGYTESIRETAESISFAFEFSAPVLEEVITDDGRWLRISIDGCEYERTPGEPLLPVVRKLVEISGFVDPIVEVVSAEYEEVEITLPIIPAQPPVPKLPGPPPSFVHNDESYRKAAWMPGEVLNLQSLGVMRGSRVAMLRVYPVRYLPAEGKLSVVRRMRVDITYSPVGTVEGHGGPGVQASPALSPMSGAMLTKVRAEKEAVDIGYLIVSADEYADELAPFVEWKREKGYHTSLVSLSQIGPSPTSSDIKDYIKDAYETWTVPPSYVLLVGDVASIPSWTGDHSYRPTDHYYSTMDDGDILPDLYLGRLPVGTEAQASTLIQKLLDYEKNGWGGKRQGDGWLDWAYFISTTDAVYHDVAESTHAYCMQVARSGGMTCDSLWGYYDTGTQIDSAFNSGRSIVAYSGHGSRRGWGGPSFDTLDVAQLQNLDMYPLVLSHACYTGDFSQNCFGESILRKPDLGSLSFFGATGLTYWDEDDVLQRAIFDALFSGTVEGLGAATQYGELQILPMGDTAFAYYYMEVYNVLGDPSLSIYTDVPHSLDVTHPDTIPGGLYLLDVQVMDAGSPVFHALVSCTADSLWTAYTDSSGIASVEVETSSEDTMMLTVTGHNLRPYRAPILVSSQNVPELPDRLSSPILFQNRPNPFGASTEIAYYVGRDGEITLEIFDLTGRRVYARKERAQRGYHTFRWDRGASEAEIASGTYFYRLACDGQLLTRKMILLK